MKNTLSYMMVEDNLDYAQYLHRFGVRQGVDLKIKVPDQGLAISDLLFQDVLILDYDLGPNYLNGVCLAEKVHELAPEIAIVIHSSFRRHQISEGRWAGGILQFWPKSHDPNVLFSRIMELELDLMARQGGWYG